MLDSSGASVPGVTIVVTNEETGVPQESVSARQASTASRASRPAATRWSRSAHRLRRHDGRARRSVRREHPRAGPEARRQRRHRDRDGVVCAGDAEHRERERGGHAHPARSPEPAAGGPRSLRTRAAHARRVRPRRAQRHRRFGADAQPGRPGRIEQLGVRDREPGADQRQRPARRGQQLPDRRRHGDEPGVGRRGGRHAEPGIGEGDPRPARAATRPSSAATPAPRSRSCRRTARTTVPRQRWSFKRNTPGLNCPGLQPGAARTARRRSASSSCSARRRQRRRPDHQRTNSSSSSPTKASRATARRWHRNGSRRPSSSRQIEAQRPGSMAAQTFAVPGMTPRHASPTCSSGATLGSLDTASTAAQPDRRPGSAAGSTASPTCSARSCRHPSDTTSRQFNARVDYNVTGKDLSRSASTSCR